jgi:hypothetical protein
MDSVETQAVVSEALTWPQRARSLRVVDGQTCVGASELLKGIKALRAKVAEVFDVHISNAFRAHKALVAEKAKAEAPLTEAEAIIKRGLAAYEQEQQRLARAESDRLAAIARQAEINRKLAEALAAEAMGDDAGAADILEEPISAAPVLVPTDVPKVSGVSYSTRWKFRIVNEKLVPREFLSVDEAKIGAWVRSQKGQVTIPGVEVYSERSVSAGGA